MNGTTGTAGLFWEMSDLQQSETHLDTRVRLVYGHLFERVSNNLGVYFLFCLFGLAIVALFVCRSMQALYTSLSFFVLRRQVWQVFMYQ